MKTTILIFDHLCRQCPNVDTYLPEQLIKAYESIGYTAFALPDFLKDQAS